MNEYLKDDLIHDIRGRAGDSRFDPALLLPNSDSDWHNMTVEIAKPRFGKVKGLQDAYVDVKYKGHSGGRDLVDEFVVGQQKLPRDGGSLVSRLRIKAPHRRVCRPSPGTL